MTEKEARWVAWMAVKGQAERFKRHTFLSEACTSVINRPEVEQFINEVLCGVWVVKLDPNQEMLGFPESLSIDGKKSIGIGSAHEFIPGPNHPLARARQAG